MNFFWQIVMEGMGAFTPRQLFPRRERTERSTLTRVYIFLHFRLHITFKRNVQMICTLFVHAAACWFEAEERDCEGEGRPASISHR